MSMQVFTSLEAVPEEFGPSVVAVGKFDGVHAGHRAIIRALRRMADADGTVAAVVTFDRNPLSLLQPELSPEALLSNRQKLELLGETGLDATLMLTFDERLRAQSPDDFVREVLVETLGARTVIVGKDFRYGVSGSGDVASLRIEGERWGFDVQLVEDVREEGRRASSTWVREALATGDIRQAIEVLGHLPTVRSVVVPGLRRGRELGYPTANLRPGPEGFVPADGVYAGWLSVDGETFAAAISIGNNPTFEGVPERQIEAYVLDQDIDLYGRVVEIAFVERLRGMERFNSVDELIDKLAEDVARTRVVMADAPFPHPR